MRNTRIGAIIASSALASATILGGAGIASAQSASLAPEAEVTGTDSIVGGDAKVTATATDNCEVAFAFDEDMSDEEWNWVVDYRVDEEEPSIPVRIGGEDSDLDEQLSVFHPVIASNQKTVDALNDHEEYEFDVGLLNKTVNLNDAGVEANETGEHTVTFKFYRGTADWQAENNQGEVTVKGCDTVEDDEGFLGSVVGSLDVFGSLEGIS